MFDRSHDVAKVYSLLKFFRNKFKQDPKLFIKDAYANMDLQREFIVKYKDLSKQYRLTFYNLANSDAINSISDYLQKFEDRQSNIVYHLEAYSDDELKEIYSKLKEKYDFIKIRGLR